MKDMPDVSRATPQEPEIVEDGAASEVYVDGMASASVVGGGMVKFTMFSLQHAPSSGQIYRRVVLRLTMPVAVAAGVQEAMASFAGQVEAMLKPEVGGAQ